MKKNLLVLFAVIQFSVNAQEQLISINSSWEFPINSFSPPKLDNFNKFDHRKLRSLDGVFIDIGYARNIWSRFDVFVGGNVDFSNTEYFFPILESNGTQVAEVNFNLQRLSFMGGVYKRFKLYENRLQLDIGFNIGRRLFPQKTKSFSSDFSPTINDWIEFDYTIATHRGEFFDDNDINLFRPFNGIVEYDMFLNANFRLSDKLLLQAKLDYSPNYYIFYDVRYQLNYYVNGSETVTGVYAYNGIQEGVKFVIKNNFVRLGGGLIYEL
ncbi:MAG: hypothetical protein Crog4KO_33430 [Crocinitomicaceae bacterium]